MDDSVKEFIKKIDNGTNAISTIGTLEFIDRISKFYNTDITCQVSKDIFENAKKHHGYEPYSTIISGDFDRQSKTQRGRRRVNPIPLSRIRAAKNSEHYNKEMVIKESGMGTGKYELNYGGPRMKGRPREWTGR